MEWKFQSTKLYMKMVVIIIRLLFSSMDVRSENNVEEWENEYQKILENDEVRNELVGDVNFACFFDFQGDEIPELLLAKGSEGVEDIFSKVVILQYDGESVEVLYYAECRMINAYYTVDTKDLVLWYPNSMGNPVEQIAIQDKKVEKKIHIFSGDELKVSKYENGNIVEEEIVIGEYGDCFAVISDDCEMFKFFSINEYL